MDLKSTLIELGLTFNQSQVYLANLQLGYDTVLNISKYANLKRPTVYLILEDLDKLGLVSKIKKGKKTMYRAEPPERILDNLTIQKQLAEGILPSLNAIYNVNPDKPTIKIADGIDSVRQVYNDIFTYLNTHPKNELIIFGSLADAMSNFETTVLDYFYALMKTSKNTIREIGNDDKETRKYYKNSKKYNPNHEVRLINEEGKFLETDDMLYGNTLVIFSVTEEIFAITLESAAIAQTYRTLFNMAWNSGKRIK